MVYQGLDFPAILNFGFNWNIAIEDDMKSHDILTVCSSIKDGLMLSHMFEF
jgi:hypothetical protein